MRILKPAVLFSWVLVFSCAPKPEGMVGNMQWMSLQQASENLQKEKRPVLIDLYTDWCSWCKVMDKKTYANKNVSAYVQQKFYAVKVNAEGQYDITWGGKTYSFNASARVNNFAIYLTNGQLSFPTTIIIPPGGEPQAIPGYLAPNEFELIVKYFGEGNYGRIPFPEFRKTFKADW